MREAKYRWTHYTNLQLFVIDRLRVRHWPLSPYWEHVEQFYEKDPVAGRKRAESTIERLAPHKVPAFYYDQAGRQMLDWDHE